MITQTWNPRDWSRISAGWARIHDLQALWYITAAGGTLLVTLAIRRMGAHVEAGQLQAGYLLLVLGLAIGGGTGPAVLASILGFLAFDWFFVRPIYSFNAGNPQEWIALGLFLLVSTSVGSLTARLNDSAAQARQRALQAQVLYEISSAILGGCRLDAALDLIVERLCQVVGLEAASVQLFDAAGDLSPGSAYAKSVSLANSVRGDPKPRTMARRPSQGERLVAAADAAEWRLRVDSTVALRARGLALALDDRLFGVLATYTLGSSPELTPDGLRVVDAFATQTLLAVGRDRLLQEEARARSAEESNRLKSTFLASISHDLRTPITSIKTEVGLLRSEPSPAAAESAMQHVDEELDRLNRLVGDLLEISRIEGGAALLQRQTHDVGELIGAAVRHIEPLLGGRRLRLESAESLPQIAVDGPQMSRVFTNILENAINFSQPNSEISVRLTAEGSAALVYVHNEGREIPPPDQERVFDKFYRVAAPSSGPPGTGLGLAIARGILDAHGGVIWTRNERRGVAFYVRLPAATSEPICPPAEIEAS